MPSAVNRILGLAVIVLVGIATVLFTPQDAQRLSSALAVAEPADAATIATLAAPALPASPVSGAIASHADEGRLYSIYLSQGDYFGARLYANGANSIGLLMYAPNTTSVEEHDKVLAGYEMSKYPSYVVNAGGRAFVAPASGRYFLRVLTTGGPGSYRFDWAKGRSPKIRVATSSKSYGSTTRVYGTVRGSSGRLLSGERVELWSAPYPSTEMLKKVAATTTGSRGTFSFAVKPAVRTNYRIVTLGRVRGYALSRSAVREPFHVGAPRVTRGAKYRKESFTTWGYFRPVHTKGAKTVRVKCYHKERQKNGKYAYVLRKTVTATNYAYSSTSMKYKRTLSLPYRGWWRMRAYAPEDSRHAANTSTYKYIYVR